MLPLHERQVKLLNSSPCPLPLLQLHMPNFGFLALRLLAEPHTHNHNFFPRSLASAHARTVTTQASTVKNISSSTPATCTDSRVGIMLAIAAIAHGIDSNARAEKIIAVIFAINNASAVGGRISNLHRFNSAYSLVLEWAFVERSARGATPSMCSSVSQCSCTRCNRYEDRTLRCLVRQLPGPVSSSLWRLCLLSTHSLRRTQNPRSSSNKAAMFWSC